MKKSRKSTGGRAKAKPGNSGNGPGHNSMAARKDTIREVCHRVTAWEAECAVIRAKITAEKQKRIKGDLGMKIADFNFALRLYKLEDDNRDQLLDTVRETFDALGVGQELDWVTIAERSEKAATEEVDEAAEAAAVRAGPIGEAPTSPTG